MSQAHPRKGIETPRSRESFREALTAVVRSEFGTQSELAKAAGISVSQISHYLKHPEKMHPSSLEGLLCAIRSPLLQRRLFEAWARQFEPIPELLPETPLPEVVQYLHELTNQGRVDTAIAIAEHELGRTRDWERWFGIAEQLEPLYLQIGQVSKALAFRSEIERRAVAAQDMRGVLSALSMTETALQSVTSADLSVIDRAHRRSLTALEHWQPQTPEGRLQRRVRSLNLARTRAHQILTYVLKRRATEDAVKAALMAVNRSLSEDAPTYVLATGLEMKARIQAAAGQVHAAEETLEALEEMGLDQAFDMWEKSQLTLARIAEQRGEIEQAIQILTEVRDTCFARKNLHHAHKADQELARLILRRDLP